MTTSDVERAEALEASIWREFMAPPPTAPSGGDLGRLLAAVAALSRQLDALHAKVDGVAARVPAELDLARLFHRTWALMGSAAWGVKDLREMDLIEAGQARALGYALPGLIEAGGLFDCFKLVRIGRAKDGVLYELHRLR